LNPYIAATRDTPKIARQVSAEVHAVAIILSALQKLAQNMASISTQRATPVTIDQVVAVLMDGVLVFSDLEASDGSLPLGAPSATRLPFRSRLQWARKESHFVSLLGRLQAFKSSVSLVLNILQRHVSPTIN
jgi:cell division control protein 24